MLAENKIRRFIHNEFDLGPVEEIKNLSSSNNQVFIIKIGGNEYILRLSSKKSLVLFSENEVQEEVLFLKYLYNNNYPIGKIYESNSRHALIELDGLFGFVRDYIEGSSIINPNIDHIRRVGEMLGWLHVLSQDYKPTFKREHEWDLDRVKKYWPENKKTISESYKDAESFIKIFEKHFNKLSFPKDLPSGMIHEDFGKRHLLWDKDKIAGVIDFDRSYIAPFIFDIGQAIRGWCFSGNIWRNELANMFIVGYQERRKLIGHEMEFLSDAICFACLERTQSFMLRGLHQSKPELVAIAFDELKKVAEIPLTVGLDS